MVSTIEYVIAAATSNGFETIKDRRADLLLFGGRATSATTASGTAANVAYGADPTGAWKGLNPQIRLGPTTLDVGDCVPWRDTLGQSVTPGAGAGGNSDGMVTQANYNIWRAQYGLTSGAGLSKTTVPEPPKTSLVAESLVAVLTVTLSSRRNGDGIRSCGG